MTSITSSTPEFFKLADLNLNGQTIAPFSVFTPFYEDELIGKRGGRDWIAHARNGIAPEELKACEALVPLFSSHSKRRELLRVLTTKYLEVNFPCSLQLSDIGELEEHVLKIVQVSNANYVLGRRASESFPKNWCGDSGRSLVASLMAHGYPQAAFAYDSIDDHGYVILPFRLKDNPEGVILADPTSDQLWKRVLRKLDKPPRNMISIFLGNQWEYRTFWGGGVDLYPNKITHGGILREQLAGDKPLNAAEFYEHGCEEFLERAFKNPITFQGV